MMRKPVSDFPVFFVSNELFLRRRCTYYFILKINQS
jgi:hypothetical protein